MKKTIAIIAAALVLSFTASAQDNEFYPGFYLGLQGGANYTTSGIWPIAHTKHINVPNVALNLGYDFTPVFGLRANISGPFANFPDASMKDKIHRFNYAQLGLDGTFDLRSLFGGYRYGRTFNPYVFVGGAANYRLASDKVAKGLNFGVRLGAGANFRPSDSTWQDLSTCSAS